MPGDKTVGVPGSTRLEQHTDGGGGVKSGTTISRQEMSNTASHDRIDVEASIRYHNRCPGIEGQTSQTILLLRSPSSWSSFHSSGRDCETATTWEKAVDVWNMYWHRGPTKLHSSSGMYRVSAEQTPPNQGWRTNTPGRTLRDESARWFCTKLATNSWLAAITICTRPSTTKLAGNTGTISPHTGRNSTTTSINETENDTQLDYNICAIVGDSHQE